MASKTSFSRLVFFIFSLHLLFFGVSSTCDCNSPPKSKPPPNPKPSPSPYPELPSPSPYPKPTPSPSPSPYPKPTPSPSPSPYPKPTPSPSPYPKPTPSPSPYPKPTPSPYPKPSPCPPSPTHEKCPRDVLKIGLCATIIDRDMLKIILGKPPMTPCCKLIDGLGDLEAAVCLCTSIKTSISGMKLDLPVSLELLLNNCGKKTPPGFKCA